MIRRWRHALWQRRLAGLRGRDSHTAAFRLTRLCLSALATVPVMAFWSNHCLGQIYESVGDRREALRYYELALHSGRVRDPSLFHHLGIVLASVGRYEEAETQLRQSIEHKPRAWWSFKALGEIKLHQNKWSEAIQLFEKTLELNNVEPWSHFHLYEARRLTLGSAAALNMWLDGVLDAPQMPQLHMRVGTLWVEDAHYSAGHMEKLRRVADRYPDCQEVSYILGFVLGKMGCVAEATEVLQQHMLLAWKRDYQASAGSSLPVKEPEFIIIGSGKGGSTALYHYLVDHPLICSAIIKEVMFWDKYYDYGLAWYRACFMPIPENAPQITGEGSITSLWQEDAPHRVAEFRRDMKLLLIIRDPVDRAYSDYHMHRRLGHELLEWDVLAEQVLQQFPRCPLEPDETLDIVHGHKFLIHSAILPYLKRWRAYFPAQQFLILRNQDLSADAQGTVNAAYAFLGLPPHTLSSTARSNVGSYPAMSIELEQRLRRWFQPHEDALANYLATDMV
ncbi:MAG: sulfotransferase domain-containing protein [Halioglobus sp.]